MKLLSVLLKSLVLFLFLPLLLAKIWLMQLRALSMWRCFAMNYTLIRRRQWHPTPVLLPGKSHGRRSLVGCSPWGRKESDTTERLHFHFSLSWIGEGNGNPLQCSCLENPRDGGAWWAVISGVAQSRTQLMRLSSSSIHWLTNLISPKSSELESTFILTFYIWGNWGKIG